MALKNHTRYAVHMRKGNNYILEFFATKQLSWLSEALIEFQSAGNVAETLREREFAREMRITVRGMANK